MKIAHINLLHYLYVGIENKLLEQASSAKKMGLDIDYFILNDEKEYREDNVIYKKFVYPKSSIKKKIMKRFFKFSLINKIVDLSDYDAIVIRYPRPISYDWKNFTDKYPSKILTEHHAIALPETIYKITFGNILNYIQEYINSKKLKNKAIGLIGVTDEISREESKRNISLPIKTISNGIDVSKVNFTKFIPFDGKLLTMTIVASEFAPWHGLDKLLKSLIEYDSVEITIILNLVGEYISDKDKLTIEKINTAKKNITIRVLGSKRGEELDEIFSKSTLAIGSLAIYRQKLEEACALKIREYLARGIPFIYSAKDPDIDSKSSFSLEFPNDNTPINFLDILEFVKKVSLEKNISDEMREYAFKNIDWKIKVKEMYRFIVELKSK